MTTRDVARWTLTIVVAVNSHWAAAAGEARAEVSVDALLKQMLAGKPQRNEARAVIVARGRAATADLIAGFQSPEFTVRWEVANILGITRDPAGVDALVDRVLHDVNSHIRWRSLWALGNITDPGIPDRFRAALRTTDTDVRWNAAIGCSMFQATEALPLLQQGTVGDDEFRTWEAVNALGRLPSASSIPSLSAALAPDRPARVRREATLTLGKHLAYPGARELLEAAMADGDPEVRWRATRSLRLEGGPPEAADPAPATPVGSGRIASPPDLSPAVTDVSPAATEPSPTPAVTEVSPAVTEPMPPVDAAYLEGLIAELRKPGDARPPARNALIAAGHAAVPRLLPLLDDADPDIRWEMATILAEIVDQRAASPLIERVLADPDPHVRWRALFAIAESPGGKAEAVNAFLSELQSKIAARAWNAAVGLAFFDHPEALEPTYRGLGAADSFMRWEAVNGLQRIHDPRAATLLEPLVFGDPDPGVRREAVLALGASCAPGAERLLVRALHESDPEIRWRAAAQLARCGVNARVALERRRSVETDPFVTEQIAEALRVLPPGP